MNLLSAKLYDPAAAVSKATSGLLAMTAFDTTNLRLAVTVPAHGMVRFRLRCAVTGATTCPVVLLGVMNGATVVGRIVPMYENATANVATQNFLLEADFIATGLTPGATNFDAAYAVQVVVAATNIKYGGPNTNAGANAWAGFMFQAYDPQPQTTTGQLSVDANGRVDVIKVAGTTQTARDLGTQLDAAVSTRMATYTQPTGFLAATFPASVASPTNITAATGITVATLGASVITAASIAASAFNGKGDWNIGKTGYALSAAGVQAIWDALTSALTTVGSAGKLLVDNINATISSRLASASYTAPLDAAGTRTAVGLASANLDTQLAAKLPTASYTAPDNASITSIKTQTDKLNFTGTDVKSTLDGETVTASSVTDKSGYALTTAPLDAAGTRAAVGLATANLDTQLAAIDDSVDTEIGAIKAKTDQLGFTSGGVDSTPTATGISAIWNALTSGMSTVGSMGKGIVDSLAQITGIKSKTDTITGEYDWDQKNSDTNRNDN